MPMLMCRVDAILLRCQSPRSVRSRFFPSRCCSLQPSGPRQITMPPSADYWLLRFFFLFSLLPPSPRPEPFQNGEMRNMCSWALMCIEGGPHAQEVASLSASCIDHERAGAFICTRCTREREIAIYFYTFHVYGCLIGIIVRCAAGKSDV